VVVVANVFPVGLRVVSLQGWLRELVWRSAGDFLPELLCGVNIGSLMNLHAKRQLCALNPNRGQEAQEEQNQPRVAINEGNSLKVVGKFPFRAFAPIGNRSSDQHFTVGEVAYFRSCGSNIASA
jgi:hypothetical protein